MSLTRPISPKVRQVLDDDPFMHKCCISNNQCTGVIQWHHHLKYGGRRSDKPEHILPLCEYHHSYVDTRNVREIVDWVWLNRLNERQIEEISKAVNYKYRRGTLNTKYVNIKISGTPPSTQHIYGHRGSATYMTREGKGYKEMCQWEIKSQYKGKPKEGLISVVIDFHFKDKLRRDIDNFNKIILDSCTGILWEDDSQIVELTLRKLFSKENPRVCITIL